MDAKHFRGGAFIGQLFLAASVALWGCASSGTGGAASPSAATTNPSGAAAHADGAAQAAGDQNGPVPDLLARKTAGYVQQMQADMDRQGGPNGGKVPTSPSDLTDPDDTGSAIASNTPPGPKGTARVNPPTASPVSTSVTQGTAAGSPSVPPADGTVRQSQVQWDQPTQAPAGTGAVVAPAPVNVPPAPRPNVQPAPRPAPAVAASGGQNPTPATPLGSSSDRPAAKPVAFPQVVPESEDLPGGSSGGGIGLQSSDDLERKLAQKIKDDPRDVTAQLDYQLLEFVKGRATPDMAAVAGLPAEDREIVTSILDGLGNFQSQVTADNNLLLVRKIQPLLEMADRLRSESDLSISAIQLCTKVDSYGKYTLADPHYKSGQENPVIVYTEISNFSSELDDTHQWQTKLSQQAILYTETGIPVWPEKPAAEPVLDQCRNRRHDFFVANVVRLPATLAPGHYLLKVTITDQLADRVAEATTPLDIAAP